MAQGLESTKVLLNGIMKTMEFTSTSILKTRSFKYHGSSVSGMVDRIVTSNSRWLPHSVSQTWRATQWHAWCCRPGVHVEDTQVFPSRRDSIYQVYTEI